MHQTIIGMIAAPLERSLRELDKRVPNREEIAKLMKLLKSHLNTQRSSESSMAELNQWSSTPGGGLRRAIRDVMSGLVLWSNQSAINPVPTNYTHRMIIFAIETLGADEVLHVVVDEVRAQTQIGFGSSALEVATALVCAPVPTQHASTAMLTFDDNTAISPSHRRTLREALRHKLVTAKDLLSMETDYVEALVRLGRRVDAQSAVPQINSINMPMATLDSQGLMQNIGMTDAEMVAGDGMDMQQQGSSMQTGEATDFSNLGESIDLTGASTAGGGGGGGGDAAGMDAVNDPNSMQGLDLSGHLFDPGQDLGFDLGSTQTEQGGGQNAAQQNNTTEDDIFAGLDMGDMGDMGDDDFSFT